MPPEGDGLVFLRTASPFLTPSFDAPAVCLSACTVAAACCVCTDPFADGPSGLAPLPSWLIGGGGRAGVSENLLTLGLSLPC